MIKSALVLCATMLTAMSMSSIAFAQDAGLYDDAIDPDKAYVRVMVQDANQASIAGTAAALLDHNISGYVSVAPGAIAVGTGTEAKTVEAGTYYTFVQKGDGFTQFIDPAIADPSKAEVLFYNTTDEPSVDLFVPAAKTNALTSVTAGTSKAVELRAPLTLAFDAQAAGITLASVADVNLERKQAVSLFLIQGPASIELVQVLNSFADAN